MEKMYQDYKDIVEFRLIYIREAHAVDSNRPSHIAKARGINEHTTYKERCSTASSLLKDNELTIPCLIDSMDNKTDADYSAKPDRVFLVDKDGTLAVAGGRGPRGFKPGCEDIEKWLVEYRKTQAEPSAEKTDLKNEEPATQTDG